MELAAAGRRRVMVGLATGELTILMDRSAGVRAFMDSHEPFRASVLGSSVLGRMMSGQVGTDVRHQLAVPAAMVSKPNLTLALAVSGRHLYATCIITQC